MLAELRIDLAAIEANITALRACVAPARLAAVVKANAYGHGLEMVGITAAEVADRLCVYELDEALALRAAGLTSRIHVLGPIAPETLVAALNADVEVTLWDRGAYAADLARAARRTGRLVCIHAKVETGVTRLGIPACLAPTVLPTYFAQPEFRLRGVFSHLAAAEELNSTYTLDQLATFLQAIAGIDPHVERHIAASAAAMLWPQTRLDAVRAGIAIYGIWPSQGTAEVMRARGMHLTPALSWHTVLVAIHDVAAQTAVGYGCTFRTQRPSRIGVIPIGYADGLPRSRSNRGYVLIAGQRVPLVGRVCMNMAFVDISDIATARVGCEVTLLGRQDREWIDAQEAADWADTIGYELVTRLPAHVPRRYRGVTYAARATPQRAQSSPHTARGQ